MCKSKDDCTKAATCNGGGAKCPEPEHEKDNETECNDGTQVNAFVKFKEYRRLKLLKPTFFPKHQKNNIYSYT